MAKYLIMGNYVGEGVAGLLKEGGSSRRDAAAKLVESLGGKMESFYYAFGGSDVFGIMDLPDNSAAASLALTVNASGAVKIRTVPLMTPEEVDEATKKSPAYRAPGS